MGIKTIAPLSDGTASPQQPALPHEISSEEAFELGALAVEGEHIQAPDLFPETVIPAHSPIPPSTVVAPPAEAQANKQPSSSEATTAKSSDNTVVVPRTTPSKAPDIPAPKHVGSPLPAVEDDQGGATLTTPQVQRKDMSKTQPLVDKMELSANSMSLKHVARLRTLGVVMNIITVLLIIGVSVGGWFIYTQLTTNGGM